MDKKASNPPMAEYYTNMVFTYRLVWNVTNYVAILDIGKKSQ